MTEKARTPVDEALAMWEAKGPTSLTVALLADALYGVRETSEDAEMKAFIAGWFAHARNDDGTFVEDAFRAYRDRAIPPGGAS